MLTDHLHRQDVSWDFSLPSELSPALFPKGQFCQALGPSVQIRPQREKQLPRVDSSECSGGGGQSAVYPVEVVAANLVPLGSGQQWSGTYLMSVPLTPPCLSVCEGCRLSVIH